MMLAHYGGDSVGPGRANKIWNHFKSCLPVPEGAFQEKEDDPERVKRYNEALQTRIYPAKETISIRENKCHGPNAKALMETKLYNYERKRSGKDKWIDEFRLTHDIDDDSEEPIQEQLASITKQSLPAGLPDDVNLNNANSIPEKLLERMLRDTDDDTEGETKVVWQQELIILAKKKWSFFQKMYVTAMKTFIRAQKSRSVMMTTDGTKAIDDIEARLDVMSDRQITDELKDILQKMSKKQTGEQKTDDGQDSQDNDDPPMIIKTAEDEEEDRIERLPIEADPGFDDDGNPRRPFRMTPIELFTAHDDEYRHVGKYDGNNVADLWHIKWYGSESHRMHYNVHDPIYGINGSLKQVAHHRRDAFTNEFDEELMNLGGQFDRNYIDQGKGICRHGLSYMDIAPTNEFFQTIGLITGMKIPTSIRTGHFDGHDAIHWLRYVLGEQVLENCRTEEQIISEAKFVANRVSREITRTLRGDASEWTDMRTGSRRETATSQREQFEMCGAVSTSF